MSFFGRLSSGTFRHDLSSGIMAFSQVCTKCTYVSAPEVSQEGQGEQQEMSMHDLLAAILEQELFFGSLYHY